MTTAVATNASGGVIYPAQQAQPQPQFSTENDPTQVSLIFWNLNLFWPLNKCLMFLTENLDLNLNLPLALEFFKIF